MGDPSWYSSFPSPYNGTYPNWNSLVHKTNLELHNLLEVIALPYPMQDGEDHVGSPWETWNYRSPKSWKPTPLSLGSGDPGGWKVPPTDCIQDFHDQVQAALNSSVSYKDSADQIACMSARERYQFMARYWLAQCTIFGLTAFFIDVPHGIPHARNLILSVDNDGTTFRYFWVDYIQNRPGVGTALSTQELSVSVPIDTILDGGNRNGLIAAL